MIRSLIHRTVLTLAICAGPVAVAQEVALSSAYLVEPGSPYPVFDGEKRYFAFGDALIAVKNRGALWYLQRFDVNGLQETASREYDDMPKDMTFEGVRRMGDHLFLFYSTWVKDRELEQLHVREIDVATATFVDRGRMVVEVKGKLSGDLVQKAGIYRYAVQNKYAFTPSLDRKYLGISWSMKLDKKEAEPAKTALQSWPMVVFDQTMTEVWKGEVTMPWPDENVSVIDDMVDAQGRLHVLASVFNTENGRQIADTGRFLFTYDHLTNDWSRVPAPYDVRSQGTNLIEGGDGLFRVVGYYGTEGDPSVKGIFVGIIRPGEGLVDLKEHAIPDEILSMYSTPKELRKQTRKEENGEEVGLNDVELVGSYHDDDGSMLLIGEERYTTTQCFTDSKGRTRCTDRYHADDLVLSRLDPNGELRWTRRLAKREISGAPIGGAYEVLVTDGSIHVLHYGFGDNLDIRPEEPPTMKGGRFLVVDRIDNASGEVVREAVLNPANVSGMKLGQFHMDRVVRTKRDQAVFEAYIGGKKDVLFRIAPTQ
ncbi:MAG: hypothetical protein IPJ87_05275 [Flavobacteriales bacterium]|nr:hypothetical protein [Flavobacteriales bacterium]MBK7941272.1 hypothetical protein [Flavobacteriales bacterium]MBK9701298.1 hypothetical protein [Flavobacteriales bacterium]